MAPADLLRVFFVGILRIDDEDVGAVQKVDQLAPRLRSDRSRVGNIRLSGAHVAKLEHIVGLVVWQKSDGAIGGSEAITDANAGVIHESRFDLDLPDRKLQFLQLFDQDGAWYVA